MINMKKSTITLSYDEERLNALKIYLGKKNSNLENELAQSLESLYVKTVPSVVREFIELNSGTEQRSEPKSPKIKTSSPSAVGNQNPKGKPSD